MHGLLKVLVVVLKHNFDNWLLNWQYIYLIQWITGCTSTPRHGLKLMVHEKISPSRFEVPVEMSAKVLTSPLP